MGPAAGEGGDGSGGSGAIDTDIFLQIDVPLDAAGIINS